MGGVINIITEDAKNSPTLTTSYRASSFGGTPKQISKDPINSIVKSSLTIPLIISILHLISHINIF